MLRCVNWRWLLFFPEGICVKCRKMLSVYKDKPPETVHFEAEVAKIADSLNELSLVGMCGLNCALLFDLFRRPFGKGASKNGRGRAGLLANKSTLPYKS